jgi:hypothetical protein
LASAHESDEGQSNSLRKKSALPLILLGAAVHRSGNCIVLITALHFEKLCFMQVFGKGTTSVVP